MKVLIICIFISVSIHGVAIWFIGPNSSKKIYPVELQFGVVEVKSTDSKNLLKNHNNNSGNSLKQNTVPLNSNVEISNNINSGGEVGDQVQGTIEMVTEYPEMSRMRGEEEEIKLQVYIDESGKVEKILFDQEPKYLRLKKAVIDAIYRAEFKEAKSIAKLKFNFKLK